MERLVLTCFLGWDGYRPGSNMFRNTNYASALAAVVAVFAMFGPPVLASTDAERIAQLEERLAQLENRLAQTEQQTKEVQVLASSAAASGSGGGSILGNQATFDILAGSAWRKLRWTQAQQWERVVKGATRERVIESLGKPPRSVKSLKPRVDEVFYYETSLGDQKSALSGTVSFRKGKVIAVRKPTFQAD